MSDDTAKSGQIVLPASTLKMLLPWLLGLAIGGGVGTFGTSWASSDDLDDLADDVQKVTKQIEAIDGKVDVLRERVLEDRWTRTNHEQWVQTYLYPRLSTLEGRIQELELSR